MPVLPTFEEWKESVLAPIREELKGCRLDPSTYGNSSISYQIMPGNKDAPVRYRYGQTYFYGDKDGIFISAQLKEATWEEGAFRVKLYPDRFELDNSMLYIEAVLHHAPYPLARVVYKPHENEVYCFLHELVEKSISLYRRYQTEENAQAAIESYRAKAADPTLSEQDRDIAVSVLQAIGG